MGLERTRTAHCLRPPVSGNPHRRHKLRWLPATRSAVLIDEGEGEIIFAPPFLHLYRYDKNSLLRTMVEADSRERCGGGFREEVPKLVRPQDSDRTRWADRVFHGMGWVEVIR